MFLIVRVLGDVMFFGIVYQSVVYVIYSPVIQEGLSLKMELKSGETFSLISSILLYN